jgi:hypothetical protein
MVMVFSTRRSFRNRQEIVNVIFGGLLEKMIPMLTFFLVFGKISVVHVKSLWANVV